MKILLLGKNGLLGSSFLSELAGLGDTQLYALGHTDLDVTDFEGLRSKIREVKPDYLINTVAMMVDDCEMNPEKAFQVNSGAVKVMAEACREVGACLVQISTDYVFDGEEQGGYDEKAEVNPINVYGESKLRAEKYIQDVGGNYLIVRTSVLYGPNEGNFIKSIVRVAEAGEQVKGVTDQVASPTYTMDLARGIIEQLMEQDQAAGIYHMTNSESCSRYELAVETFKILGMDVSVEKISSGDLKRPAKRPRYTILKNTKLKPLRSWKEALRVYIDLNIRK